MFFNAPGIILVLYYAHSGTLADSSDLGLAYAIVGPLYLFFSMQHGLSILSGKKLGEVCLKERLILSPLIFIFVVVAACFVGITAIPALALFRIADILFEPVFYEFSRAEKYLQSFVWSAVRFLVFCSGLLVLQLYSWEGVTDGLLFLSPWLIGFSVYAIHKNMNSALIFENWNLKTVYFSESSLGLSALIASIVVNVPRYFIGKRNTFDLAFYSNMLTIVLGFSLFYIVLSNLLFGRMSSRGSSGVQRFFNLSLVAAFWCMVACIFLSWAGGGLELVFVDLAFGSKYRPNSDTVFLFFIFLVLLYLQNSINSVLIYFKRNRFILSANILLFFFVLISLLVFAEPTVKSVISTVNIASAGYLIVFAWLVNKKFFIHSNK